MPHEQYRDTDLAKALQRFIDAAATIWEKYQAEGPGKVDEQLLPPVQFSAGQVQQKLGEMNQDVSDRPSEGWTTALAESVDIVFRLARRCILRPEGLCFVTGEAGLVPRRDLHESFKNNLHEASRLLAELDEENRNHERSDA